MSDKVKERTPKVGA